MGHTLSGVRVLRMDRPSAGGFLGLTALQAEGCGGGFAAVFYAACGGKSRKPYNRAWGPLEMHPFCLQHLPRRGRFALRLL